MRLPGPANSEDLLQISAVNADTMVLGWQTPRFWSFDGNAIQSAWNGSTGASVSTTNSLPLTLATRGSIPQPIRFYTGDSGSMMAMEISGYGDVTIGGRLGIGNGVAAGLNEVVRISSLLSSGGVGLCVDLTGTTTSNGIVVRSVGATGTTSAGIVVGSASAGSGTGIRLGHVEGSGLSSLSTAIDITGGTGIRYNAWTSGSGTALVVGKTAAPQRGVDVTASGSNHIGGIFRANMGGTGLIGISHSASFADPDAQSRLGVLGSAATASSATSDVITGVRGYALRGGTGGGQTTSVGVEGLAVGASTNHAGLVIGILGKVSTTAAGNHSAVAGLFHAADSGSTMALIARGDVYLGSTEQDRPPGMIRNYEATLRTSVQSTTWLFNSRISGQLLMRPRVVDWAALTNNAELGDATVFRVTAPVDCELTGLQGGEDGRVVILLVAAGELTLTSQDDRSEVGNRFITTNGNNLVIGENGSVTLIYDGVSNRWRIMCCEP